MTQMTILLTYWENVEIDLFQMSTILQYNYQFGFTVVLTLIIIHINLYTAESIQH